MLFVEIQELLNATNLSDKLPCKYSIWKHSRVFICICLHDGKNPASINFIQSSDLITLVENYIDPSIFNGTIGTDILHDRAIENPMLDSLDFKNWNIWCTIKTCQPLSHFQKNKIKEFSFA